MSNTITYFLIHDKMVENKICSLVKVYFDSPDVKFKVYDNNNNRFTLHVIANLHEYIADTDDNNIIVEKIKKILCRLRNVYSDEEYIIDSKNLENLYIYFDFRSFINDCRK